MMALLFTLVFGFLWWVIYSTVGASLTYLVILGSVLAVCVCCCKHNEGDFQPGDGGLLSFNWDKYWACLRRCRMATLILMLGLALIGVAVVWRTTMAAPTAAEITNILMVAIGVPFCIRLICCAYEA
ncbi:MAG: hypothetical protein WCE79_12230 [Xanthobacteraceae bacterium]